jgi:hypothetical protein
MLRMSVLTVSGETGSSPVISGRAPSRGRREQAQGAGTSRVTLPLQCAHGEVPVMAGPRDEQAGALAGRSHLRASHADREQVIETLKAAFVQGRLAKDEFDLRVSKNFGSRTYAEIATLTADLPVELIRASPPAHPAPAQAQPVSKVLMWGACVIMVGAAGSILAALSTNTFLLLVAGVLGILIAAPVAGTLMLDWWRGNRSGGQSPPRPA